MSPIELVFTCLLVGIALGDNLYIEKSSAPMGSSVKGRCSCGGFSTNTPAADTEPLLSQTPRVEMSCDDVGAGTCKSLCLALATATKAEGPDLLCKRLINVNELKLSAFYKICNDSWTYADITAEEPLCCEDSKSKICASVDTTSTTTNLPSIVL